MYNAVGIDASKFKSTITVIQPAGVVIRKPFDVLHTSGELNTLVTYLQSLEGETRAVIECTGRYHEPVVKSLSEAGIFISAVNPKLIKGQKQNSLRKVKSDPADARKIARYALDNWAELRQYSSMDTIGNKQDAIKWIRNTVSDINDLIFKYTSEHSESKGMGTTLVIAIYTKDFLLFGNIGDSSGFVKKDNKLFKVTKDHTLVNLLISTGELTLEEAKFHPKKNVLMKALGAVNPAEVDIFDVEKNIDGILLSSDGLTNMLSVEQIENVLKMDISLEDKAKKLIAKSNNRGGTDNISVALLECESGEE